jgi:hypothetical protein
MATSIKLKGDIKKIEAAIKSKATPKSLVPKLEAQLDKLKSDLASLSSAKPKKGVTKTKVLSSLQKLKAKIKATKSLSGYKKSGIDIKKDADIPALPLGKRYSQTTGNPYYEYRLNRADVKQPPKRYPKLEDGGYMARGGETEEEPKVIRGYSDDKAYEYAQGGMLQHGFRDGDNILEIYKGYGIVENNNNGVIEVLNPNQGTRFIIDLDDSKSSGMRASMGMSKTEQIESAKRYIDYLDEKLEDGGMMAQGGRTLSAINRDRAYKSNQPWEQDYQRKSRPKNPKYKSSSDFFEEGGEMHRLFEDGEA